MNIFQSKYAYCDILQKKKKMQKQSCYVETNHFTAHHDQFTPVLKGIRLHKNIFRSETQFDRRLPGESL